MIVLGIESSCDETAAALVRDDGTILSDVVSSQVKLHAPYGGVVPEIASRAHMTNIAPVLGRALEAVDGGLEAVDAVAATNGPGLVGALLVGLQVAKAIAWVRSVPFVGVNHLVGHLLSIYLRREGDSTIDLPPTPFIALLVSGGHTALYEVRGPLEIEQLGQTRDDAAGEAFDKVAKLLGLGYPGGPLIDKLAARGDHRAIALPRPMALKDNLEFSFSGLKTAVARYIAKNGRPEDDRQLADFCASFQRVVVDVLVRKSLAACRQRRVEYLVLSGGVAANIALRDRMSDAASRAGVRLYKPPLSTCTDNAAMIAYAGAERLKRGLVDNWSLGVFSRSPILGACPGSAVLKRYKSSRLPR
ncbi:MAG: tRNA (adenosine(37)-N6)-threonylcarbamoyltransferase complex transferase subunit TsaD [Deltaproteobacteria bacterium]|nr:tRNA (adenosine(37)-N6)-threonylcarbamoyltransferase complex transferase subunit TsaD [Deltaproteobacteria bacterium]